MLDYCVSTGRTATYRIFFRCLSNLIAEYQAEGGISVEWSEDLAVGIDDIDEQHKELFRRINKLVESVR